MMKLTFRHGHEMSLEGLVTQTIARLAAVSDGIKDRARCPCDRFALEFRDTPIRPRLRPWLSSSLSLFAEIVAILSLQRRINSLIGCLGNYSGK